MTTRPKRKSKSWRLTKEQIDNLLTVGGYDQISASLAKEGYRMQPVHGIKLRNGSASFAFAWVKRSGNATIKHSIRFRVERLAA